MSRRPLEPAARSANGFRNSNSYSSYQKPASRHWVETVQPKRSASQLSDLETQPIRQTPFPPLRDLSGGRDSITRTSYVSLARDAIGNIVQELVAEAEEAI